MKYIHIAGTNGKGSVAEYLYNIIMASGASCGCYTSPHLVSPTERIRLNGKEIDADCMEDLMLRVENEKLAENETLFAQYTAAAFEWFKKEKPEFAVIETGLGGRFDPTNVIKEKTVILTPISYDHMQYLGYDIKDIADEKCGIIKKGNYVISEKQINKVKAVIEKRCEDRDAELIYTGEIRVTSHSLKGQSFIYAGKKYKVRSIGRYQPQNAAAAIECAYHLGIDYENICKGLESTVVKARTQYVPGDPTMLIDGAHNPAAISMLCKTLGSLFKSKKKVLLFACMQDKDYDAMIEILAPHFLSVVIVSVDKKRGADVHELHKLFSKHIKSTVELDLQSGLDIAKKTASEKDALLVVCGSLYLAGSSCVQQAENNSQ